MRILFMLLLAASPAWAAEVMVCERPDEGVSVIRFPADEPIESNWQRTLEAQPELSGFDCTQTDDSQIPTNRSQRYAWRMDGEAVVVDATVPNPHAPPPPGEEPVEIPVKEFGAGIAGALTALGVRTITGRKKKEG